MIKKIALFLSVALPFSFEQSFACWGTFEKADTDGRHAIRAT